MQILEKAHLGAILLTLAAIPAHYGKFAYLADGMLWVVFLLGIVRIAVSKDVRSELPPLPLLGFLLAAFISGIVSEEKCLKECIQFTGLFLTGYVGIRTLALDSRNYRILICALQMLAVGVAAWGLFSSFSADFPFQPNQPFANRHLYSAFVMLTVPMVVGLAVFRPTPINIAAGLFVAMASLFSVSTAPVFIFLMLSCIAVAMVRSTKLGVIVSLLMALTIAFGFRVMPHNDNRLQILADSVSYYYMDSEEDSTRAVLRTMYAEWFASAELSREMPWFGTGPGTYQRYIGSYFGAIPKPNVNDLEPHSNSMYAVIGATAGIPALLLLIVTFIQLAIESLKAPISLERGAQIGLGIALICMIPVSLFVMPIAKGIGPLLAVVFALAGSTHAGMNAPPESDV